MGTGDGEPLHILGISETSAGSTSHSRSRMARRRKEGRTASYNMSTGKLEVSGDDGPVDESLCEVVPGDAARRVEAAAGTDKENAVRKRHDSPRPRGERY